VKWKAKEGQLLLASEAMHQEHLHFCSELKAQFDRLLAHEGANAQEARSQVKGAHQEALRQLAREGQEEVMNNRASGAEYEKECLERYEQLVEGLNEMNAVERTEVLHSDMEEFRKAFELQAEREMLNSQACEGAEDAVKNKFARILADLEGNWQKEAKEHETTFEQQLREHYEQHLEKVQQQADTAVQARQENDQHSQVFYFTKLAELQAEEVETIHEMTQEMQENFAENFLNVQRSLEARSKHLEAKRQSVKHATQGAHEERLRQLKQRYSILAKAKGEVERAVKAKYRSVSRDYYTLQKQYHEEVEVLHQGEAVALEKELAETAAEAGGLLSYLNDHAQAMRMRRQREATEDWDAVLAEEALEQSGQLVPTLEKLWGAVMADDAARLKFFDKAADCQSYSPETLTLYKEYAERLENRLPIMKILTRREHLKKKFEQIRKKAADPGRLFAVDSSHLLKEEQELSEICMELLQHDTALKDLIPSYEGRFNEMFMFEGRRYLAVIDADSAELKAYLQNLVPAAAETSQPQQQRLRSKYSAGREGTIASSVSPAHLRSL